MDVDKMYLDELPDSPYPRQGSMKGSPTSLHLEDKHTVTDVKNISIEDDVVEAQNSVSQTYYTL